MIIMSRIKLFLMSDIGRWYPPLKSMYSIKGSRIIGFIFAIFLYVYLFLKLLTDIPHIKIKYNFSVSFGYVLNENLQFFR